MTKLVCYVKTFHASSTIVALQPAWIKIRLHGAFSLILDLACPLCLNNRNLLMSWYYLCIENVWLFCSLTLSHTILTFNDPEQEDW